ncbi:AAA family ATPase [Nocardioides sp.]|uniref:ATP-binding protein n=1 Tax=Nocardioides sp. TaxID=35761 RepID=UPI0035AF4118
MSALPRPDVAGPARTLNDALHDLHHRAGWPSLRTLARETGVSHTTVSKVFSSGALPGWGTLELLVEALGGDVGTFHDLWLAASSPTNGSGPAPGPGIAGRRAELDVVRRHLAHGRGLLLVTGEAGMGKTTLVQAATASPDALVLAGRCLPLSIDVPLMPVCDALRDALAQDDGRRLATALASCPAFVAVELARLVPELGTATAADDSLGRQHLFTAVGAALAALARDGRVAVVLEDLHWADTVTLDLLEHMALSAADGDLAFVGTWRDGDPGTPAVSTQWRARVERAPASSTVRLGPLTREETEAQLVGLGTVADVEAVFSRSRGHPLFTTHLAAHLPEAGLPHALSDLLDARLEGLDPAPWRVVRALGVADRPLPATVVGTIAGLEVDELAEAMRSLRALRLLGRGDDADNAVLDHPLLAEAARRRLVPGEGREVHRRLARALANSPAPEPAEVALHWQRATEPGEELPWRVAAALESARRFDWSQEAEQWLRVLEIWPDGLDSVGEPPTRLSDAYLAAIDALDESFQWDRGAALSAEAEHRFATAPEEVRVEVLLRAAAFRGEQEGVSVGLALIDQALEIHRLLPEGPGLVRALNRKRLLLEDLGRFDEALVHVREAAEVSARIGDARLQRYHRTTLAGPHGTDGDVAGCFELLRQAAALTPDGTDPLGDIRQAVMATDVLLKNCATVDEIEAVARPAFEAATSLGVDSEMVMFLRGNVVEAMLRAGQVARATALLGVGPDDPPDYDHWVLHFLRAEIDVISGRVIEGAARFEEVRRVVGAPDSVQSDFLGELVDMDYWTGTPTRLIDQILHCIQVNLDGGASPRMLFRAVVGAARSIASGADPTRGRSPYREVVLELAERCGIGSAGPSDDPCVAAHRCAVSAELARHDGTATAALWADVAARWDALDRPHDAAYARWRAAQCALREGRGTVAARLLKRAAADAREHVPLTQAITRTAAGA